jgi:hypothetical protein
MLGEQAAVLAAKMLCLDTSPSFKMMACRGANFVIRAKMALAPQQPLS